MEWIAKVHDLTVQGLPFAIATVVDTGGSTPREVGAKMIVTEQGLCHGTVGGGQLEKLTLEAAAKCLAEGASRLETFSLGPKTAECCGGVVQVFIEVAGPSPTLHLFGSGHVGLEVIEVLRHSPYRVLVHDDRPEWSSQAAQKGARTSAQDSLAFARAHAFAPSDTAAVMTHSHDLDLDLVAALAPKNLRYLGLIGSQSKWTRFQQRLKERGLASEHIARIECPLGLPIGGKSPREVAISLAARLIQVHHG